MLALFYLLIACLLGGSIRRHFLDEHSLIARSSFSVKLIADFFFGLLPMTTLNYFLAVGFSAILPESVYPLLPSNIIVMTIALVIVILGYVRSGALLRTNSSLDAMRRHFDFSDKKILGRTVFYSVSVFVFCIWAWFLTAFVFRSENAYLGSGFSVFSDYAPHTAVIRSFSVGRNFPAEYPHFGGDGIQYHFFFFFLAGNLNYLGLDLTTALNLPSAIGLVACCILIGTLAERWSHKQVAFLLAPMLIFLRSSNAVWHWLGEVPALAAEAGESVLTYIRTNDIFIGRLPMDDWGLWNLNVYANQRHLLFSLAIGIIILFVFLPTLEEASLKTWLQADGWLPRNWLNYVPAFLLLICLPYWHGSVTVTVLMMLALLAIFSRDKLAYAAAAAISITMALVYSRVFSGESGSAVSFSFEWGFIAPDTSLPGVLSYLWELLGLSLPAILILPFLQASKRKRIVAVSFMLPLIFAFTISLTPDVTVNHKYVMFSQIFATILLSDFILRCWRLKAVRRMPAGKIAAVILTFILTFTGVIDVITYRNKNQNLFYIEEDGALETWLAEETEPDDLFLTPPWHYHSFFLSGRKAWYGHAYYAWSAGHDTAGRELEVAELWLGTDQDPNIFIDYCLQHSIRYAIIADDLRYGDHFVLNEDFFIENFEIVASFPEQNNAVIYRIH